MLVAPLAAVRQLSALALVMVCFFAAVQGMRQPDLLTVGGGFLLIGGAIGLGIAFALARNAYDSGPELAMVGWAGCAIPLVLQAFVAFATYSPPRPARTPAACTSIRNRSSRWCLASRSWRRSPSG